jgi:endonuclease/exonuclease/phosphatase family metal-dependent hydrolase
VSDDQRRGRTPSRLAKGFAPAVLLVVVVVVVSLAAVVVRRDARSSGSPGAPVSTATQSPAPAVTDRDPVAGPPLQPVAPGPGCSAERSQTVRVLQFNIHAGIDPEGEPDPSHLAAEIAAARPDLVSLNEVDDGTRRSDGIDEASYLSRATGLQAVFGPTLLGYDGGRFGNAILSRYPILESHDTPLPQVTNFEARALLTATVRVGRQVVSFSSLHLSAGSGGTTDRVLEASAVAQVVRAAHHPTIVAGDLNSTPGTLPELLLRHRLLDAQEQSGTGAGFTVPEQDPQTRIDYVLYDTHFSAVPGSTQVLPSAVSDHRSVLTELMLRPIGC